MTQFNAKAAEQPATASGQDFLASCRERLEDVVADCVANYDGQSVEDFARDLFDAIWEVEHDDLKRSFKNGRDYRRPGSRSR